MIIIDAKSPDGNAFLIMAAVRRFLIQKGREDEWEKVQDEMMSGDYNELCDLAEDVTDSAIIVENRD